MTLHQVFSAERAFGIRSTGPCRTSWARVSHSARPPRHDSLTHKTYSAMIPSKAAESPRPSWVRDKRTSSGTIYARHREQEGLRELNDIRSLPIMREVKEMNLDQRPNSYEGKNCFQWAFVAKKVMAERDLLRLTMHELEAKLDLYVSQAQEANRR